MANINRGCLVIATLIVGLLISGCGASNRTITFRTEIQNASSLTDYNLDFENGDTKLLLVPIERYEELEFTIFTLPGSNDRMVLPVSDENEFASIPLAEKVDVELTGIKSDDYVLVVNSYRVSDDERIRIGPMLLMVELNGAKGLYAMEVDKETDPLVFNPDQSFLAIP